MITMLDLEQLAEEMGVMIVTHTGGKKGGWNPATRTVRPEVSLVFWTGVFLSPGRRICVIGKETGPGPGGYG